MLDEVEVAKNLMDNQKRDFEIRKNDCKSKVYSQYKKLELNIN